MNGMAGAQLFGLQCGRVVWVGALHIFLAIAYHKDGILFWQEGQGIQHIGQQRFSGSQPHDLGEGNSLRLQPGALPGGQNNGFDLHMFYSLFMVFAPAK